MTVLKTEATDCSNPLRKVAERLIPNLHCSCACGEPKCMNCVSDIDELEAVMREVVKATLEEAVQACIAQRELKGIVCTEHACAEDRCITAIRSIKAEMEG